MLQSMGSQKVRHNRATETELKGSGRKGQTSDMLSDTVFLGKV